MLVPFIPREKEYQPEIQGSKIGAGICGGDDMIPRHSLSGGKKDAKAFQLSSFGYFMSSNSKRKYINK